MLIPPYFSGIPRFNRYMVECKYFKRAICRKPVYVLIDTWWNVNQGTLSNVENNTYRFNRYMVECK